MMKISYVIFEVQKLTYDANHYHTFSIKLLALHDFCKIDFLHLSSNETERR